jgi:hypothetical protein
MQDFRNEFKQWLQSLNPKDKFATYDCGTCPIATFFFTNRSQKVNVEPLYDNDAGSGVVKISGEVAPDWVYPFVEIIDTHNGDERWPLTVAYVIDVLEGI